MYSCLPLFQFSSISVYLLFHISKQLIIFNAQINDQHLIRYSIWLDSKLRLQRDPLLILEYFLWRRGYEYAISNHYDRHCVWEEVMQNKKLNKFNHSIIDQQFHFYQQDGLKRFDPSDPNKLLPSCMIFICIYFLRYLVNVS